MGAFWDIIQAELDRERFAVSDRKLAIKLRVSPTTIANWRSGLNELPTVRSLQAVAEFSGRSYEDVLLAALADTGHADGTRFARRRGEFPRNLGGPALERMSDEEYRETLRIRDRGLHPDSSDPDESIPIAALDVDPDVDQEAGESTEG